MREEYLWDRSGPPDPEIERLEVELASLRYRFHRGIPGAPRRPARGGWLAAAACLLLAVAALLSRGSGTPAAPTAWRMGSVTVLQGQVLRSGDSPISLEAEPVGRVELGPGSELRAATSRQLELRRGRLHAFIWAPPREFVVETASARAVDLGCQYTLDVDGAGNGLLRVETGWVAFQSHGHESFIPAGAACPTHQRQGPGIPFYEDALEAFTGALAAYESGDDAALVRVLAAARPRDGLTLWHLLPRVAATARGAVFDRFAQLVGVPRELRAGAVQGDAKTLDLCWNALNLEDTGWWRGWERPWR
ncbi:MAG: hypothetical protein ABSE42_21295 [Bryobacteraceae bacterium]|jgi:hypothetical protein